MSFTISSLLFLTAGLFLFYIIKPSLRVHILCAVSLFYIWRLSVSACITVIVTTAIVYFMAQLISKNRSDKPRLSKTICTLGCILCILSLCVYKYASKMVPGDGVFGPFSKIVIPIGFSYYIFQSIGFLVETYKEKFKEFPKLSEFLLYQIFFAKFLSGPIERMERFQTSLKKISEIRFLDEERLSLSFSYIIYGYFMKLMIADRLASYTPFFLEHPSTHESWSLVVGSLMYTVQIYADFAGYSSIALGIASLFGIKLTQNFRAPYLAESMSDFWRRWHISLSSWLKDHIYIPLGGNRKGSFRKYLNTFIVFVVCGLWHGNGMNFLVWGMMHGIFSVVDVMLDKTGIWKNKVCAVIRRILVFCSVSFAWIFFGSGSFSSAITFLKYMILGTGNNTTIEAELTLIETTMVQIVILLISIAVMVVFDILIKKKNMDFGEILAQLPLGARLFSFYVMIMVILVFGAYGPSTDITGFMYMQF
ncbi:MAG: MBOAT family protein [Butyrivibrio sp.]|nr:MBOAT family protein [Butyrivibrio sp.]